MSLILRLEPVAGSTVKDVFSKAISIAQKLDTAVVINTNGVESYITDCSDVDHLMDQYNNELQQLKPLTMNKDKVEMND